MTPHVLGPGFGGAIDENSPLRALAHAAADLYGATLAVEREFSDCSAALWMRTAAIWMRVQCRDGTMIVAA